MAKKYFVEVRVGVFMDEMDDNSSPEYVAEIADRLVNEAICEWWNTDIVTTATESWELHPATQAQEVLDAYTMDGLDRIIANSVD